MGEGQRRPHEIPFERLPFSPSKYLLDRLSEEDRQQVLAVLAQIGASLRRAAQGDEPDEREG